MPLKVKNRRPRAELLKVKKPQQKRRVTVASNAACNIGGPGLNLSHLLQGLKDFAPTVISAERIANLPSYKVDDSALRKTLERTPYLRRRKDWDTLLRAKKFDQGTLEVLKQIKTDVLFALVGQTFESLRYAKEQGAFCILDVVNNHIDDYWEHVSRECNKFHTVPFISKSILAKTRESYHLADRIRVMSTVAKKTFVERGISEEKIFVVPPPIEINDFPATTQKAEKFRVSFAGLLEPWKGFHYLVDAFEQANLPDSELIFWGGTGARSIAQYFSRIMARSPNVMIKNVGIRNYGYGRVYGASHVLVHPSTSDGFAYVVAEAMACGTPVITTDNTGAEMLIEEGISGYIVPVADSQAIGERLKELHKNPKLLKKMSKAARETAESYTMQRFTEQLTELLLPSKTPTLQKAS